MTTDDLKELPHIVLIETDDGLRLVEFEGDDAGTKANLFAYNSVKEGFDGRILVAARYHQLGNYDYACRTKTGICR